MPPEERDIVDAHQAAWIAAHVGVPGAEVHRDRDVVWMVQPGSAWSNAAAAVRLGTRRAAARLDEIVARYRSDGRGAGFWIGPGARPADVEALLRARGFRCRKRFPGMRCILASARRAGKPPRGLRIEPVGDPAVWARSPSGHPYFGPVTSPLRRFEMDRLAHLTSRRPRRTWELAAFVDEVPVGACTLFVAGRVAGLHDVGVLESHRNRGVGTALVGRACDLAGAQGAALAVLISSGMGESVYAKVGFEEICRMAFWYQAFR